MSKDEELQEEQEAADYYEWVKIEDMLRDVGMSTSDFI